VSKGDGDDYCPKSRWRFEWRQQNREKRIASENAKWRVDCAKWRREERVALANARQRARELKALAAAKESHSKMKDNKKATAAEEEPKIKGKVDRCERRVRV
jgi:hypothetical protein